jgi:hypothetical protein
VSAIDGRKVKFRGKDDWVGLVQGDSYTPGTVRVAWSEPVSRTGVHRVIDLEAIDEAPTQEDLANMFYGVDGAH